MIPMRITAEAPDSNIPAYVSGPSRSFPLHDIVSSSGFSAACPPLPPAWPDLTVGGSVERPDPRGRRDFSTPGGGASVSVEGGADLSGCAVGHGARPSPGSLTPA